MYRGGCYPALHLETLLCTNMASSMLRVIQSHSQQTAAAAWHYTAVISSIQLNRYTEILLTSADSLGPERP